jgi:hypothetical protein
MVITSRLNTTRVRHPPHPCGSLKQRWRCALGRQAARDLPTLTAKMISFRIEAHDQRAGNGGIIVVSAA